MKKSEIEGIAAALASVLKDFVTHETLDEYRTFIRDTFKMYPTTDDLKSLREMQYCGVYDATRKYARGSFVTHAGSLWHANEDFPTSKPGDGSVAWTLAVKRGKDGKSADAKAVSECMDSLTALFCRVADLEADAARLTSIETELQELKEQLQRLREYGA